MFSSHCLIFETINYSSGEDSPEDEIPEPSDDDAPYVVKSDHEFSPESDVNDEEYQPTRRARTARRDKSKPYFAKCFLLTQN